VAAGISGWDTVGNGVKGVVFPGEYLVRERSIKIPIIRRITSRRELCF
jgi:hypothetical protein